jgi:hypothetical protein
MYRDKIWHPPLFNVNLSTTSKFSQTDIHIEASHKRIYRLLSDTFTGDNKYIKNKKDMTFTLQPGLFPLHIYAISETIKYDIGTDLQV